MVSIFYLSYFYWGVRRENISTQAPEAEGVEVSNSKATPARIGDAAMASMKISVKVPAAILGFVMRNPPCALGGGSTRPNRFAVDLAHPVGGQAHARFQVVAISMSEVSNGLR